MRPYSQPDISYWELVQQLPSAPRWKRKPEVNSKTGERDGYQRTVIWRFEGGGSVPRKLEPWDVGWVEIE